MEIVSNVIAPIVQLIIYIVMILWVIYLIYWIKKNVFPNLEWQIKYKILRKSYNENDVQACVDAIEKFNDPIKFKKDILLKGNSMRKTSELLYIYKQVQKKLKGGVKK